MYVVCTPRIYAVYVFVITAVQILPYYVLRTPFIIAVFNLVEYRFRPARFLLKHIFYSSGFKNHSKRMHLIILWSFWVKSALGNMLTSIV